ncbi:hypothetical protein [Microbacterium sp. MPKO10]|uniref:hypothetical protein n=1 Tax=Microbacterium sp. MPKO10 TaxID=2989818 RepID=UPI0022355101|nr:hypothetical protein [Microbacterium sp. MPKO10]MCW4458618.1 hypothetical protein [Microbacterium sp. MPKO10]
MTKSQTLVVAAGCMVAVLLCLATIVIAQLGMKDLSGERASGNTVSSVTTVHDTDAVATLLVA